jgi:glutathione S-transferase
MIPYYKLYGVPLSPPFRAVAWTMLSQQIKFDVHLTIPGATNSRGSLHPSFLEKTLGRCNTVPILQVGHDENINNNESSTFYVTDSASILLYLCETHGWDHLFPSSSIPMNASSTTTRPHPMPPPRTVIHSYLHWHHENTRLVANLTKPYVRPELELQTTLEQRNEVHKVLEMFNHGWLSSSSNNNIATTGFNFIGGVTDHPSIADVLAYEEIAQAVYTECLDLSSFPALARWYNIMSTQSNLMHYDAIHQPLVRLGSLKENNDPASVTKRLGAATKEGLLLIKQSQP